MTDHPSGPLTWVALDAWDVDPADLEAAGQPWEAVIPAEVDNHIDAGIGPLPETGWREVTIQTEGSSPQQGRLFAAPVGEGWAVAYLSPPLGEGKPILSAGPEVHLRPGTPSRRRGLRLTWPTQLAVRAGDLKDVRITLTNVGDVIWHPDPGDAQHVHAWLLDDRRERLGSDWIVFGGSGHDLHELAPGQALSLPVGFGPDAHLTPPGTYEVEAVMPALNLWSPPGRILVLP